MVVMDNYYKGKGFIELAGHFKRLFPDVDKGLNEFLCTTMMTAVRATTGEWVAKLDLLKFDLYVTEKFSDYSEISLSDYVETKYGRQAVDLLKSMF